MMEDGMITVKITGCGMNPQRKVVPMNNQLKLDSENKLHKVFICSPFRGIGNTEETMQKDYRRNIAVTKAACRYATEQGCVPYCPHLYFPRFLMDEDPQEREIGMIMGLSWLARCDELWVIGRRISEGMEREIAKAKEWNMPIKHFVFKRSPEERLLDAILNPDIDYQEMV